MRAVIASEPGGPEVLTVTQLDDPTPAPGEVVIDVVGTAVNRADTLQRQGLYPPPKGASDVLGLECSGRVSAVGAEVERLAGRRRGLRAARRRRVRREGRRPGGAGDARPRRGRPGHGRRPSRGRLHGLVQRLHGRRAPGRRDTARARRRRRHRHHGDPARARARRPGRHHGRVARRSSSCAARSARTSTIDYHQQDFVEEVRAPPTAAARTSSWTTWAPPTWPQRRRAGHRGPPGDHRYAGRHQGRAEHRQAARASVAPSSPRRCGRGPSRRRRRSAPPWSSMSGPWSPRAPCKPIVHTTLPLEQAGAAHRLMEDGGHVGKIVLTS